MGSTTGGSWVGNLLFRVIWVIVKYIFCFGIAFLSFINAGVAIFFCVGFILLEILNRLEQKAVIRRELALKRARLARQSRIEE